MQLLVNSTTLEQYVDIKNTVKYGLTSLFIRRTTRGLVSDYQSFYIEVCGLEQIMSTLSVVTISF